MKRLQVLKNRFFPTKSQQTNVNTMLNEAKPQTMIIRVFSNDEDTFMFI